jgi:ferredoxin
VVRHFAPLASGCLDYSIDRHQKVLFVGCGTCVTVCLAGGEREVGIAGYGVRMARKLAKQPVDIEQITIERQCDNEFIKDLAPAVERSQAVVSFGCAAGVQALAERFPGKPVYPGLNTQFLGILEEQATWTEKCIGCGECMLAEFGGICPVTRCAKHMLNGPCGGSTSERCEVSADKPCAWQPHLQAATVHRPARSPGKDSSAERLEQSLARRREEDRKAGAPDLDLVAASTLSSPRHDQPSVSTHHLKLRIDLDVTGHRRARLFKSRVYPPEQRTPPAPWRARPEAFVAPRHLAAPLGDSYHLSERLIGMAEQIHAAEMKDDVEGLVGKG